MSIDSELYSEAFLELKAQNHERALRLLGELIRKSVPIEVLAGRVVCQTAMGKVGEAATALETLKEIYPQAAITGELASLVAGGNHSSSSLPLDLEVKLISASDYIIKAAGKEIQIPRFSSNNQAEKPCFYIIGKALLGGTAGIIITPSGEIIQDSLLYEDVKLELQRSSLTAKINLSSPVLPLYFSFSDTFWHWIMEALPYAIFAEEVGFTGTYIVPRGGPFIIESLELLGISKSRIIEHSGDSISVDQLWVPKRIAGWIQYKTPELLDCLRERLLPQKIEPQSKLRLYISRNKSRRPRQVVNETELIAELNKYGFTVVHLEEYSLVKQMELISRAAAIVAPHGSATALLSFARPASLFVELFSPSYINSTMLPVIERHKIKYFMLPSGTNPHKAGDYPHGEDIKVCLYTLKILLDRELEVTN